MRLTGIGKWIGIGALTVAGFSTAAEAGYILTIDVTSGNVTLTVPEDYTFFQAFLLTVPTGTAPNTLRIDANEYQALFADSTVTPLASFRNNNAILEERSGTPTLSSGAYDLGDIYIGSASILPTQVLAQLSSSRGNLNITGSTGDNVVQIVPEPASALLLLCGVGAVCLRRHAV